MKTFFYYKEFFQTQDTVIIEKSINTFILLFSESKK